MAKSQSISGDILNGILEDSLSISEHVKFLRELVDRHEWQLDALDKIHNSIDSINRRIECRFLHLGLVGEFSSGKSTLANALIADDLLKTDVVQATTCAATWIRHGKELDVDIVFADDNILNYYRDEEGLWVKNFGKVWKSKHESKKRRIRKFIHKVTSVEEYSSRIKSINITHPAKSLGDGLVIVDLPGLNSANARHGDVVKESLRNDCDAAIIVIPADVPLSQYLIDFLRIELKNHLHRCLFVITKIDSIREAEFERFLATIRSRIEQELKIVEPAIYPLSPELAISSDNSSASYVDTFNDFKMKANDILQNSRDVVILEKLCSLLEMIMEWLPLELAKYEKKYKTRHDKLSKAIIPKLDDFIASHRSKMMSALDGEIDILRGNCIEKLSSLSDDCICRVKNEINKADSKSNLSDIMNNTVQNIITKFQKNIDKCVKLEISNFQDFTAKEMKKFDKVFEKIYNKLRSLSYQNELTRVSDYKANDAKQIEISKSNEIASNAALFEKLSMGGGLGIGAVLGTVVLPGFGTVAGAWLGGWVGSLFGPDISNIKDKCKSNLAQEISNISWKQREAINETFADLKKSTEVVVDDRLNLYKQSYKSVISKLIKEDNLELKSLRQKRTLISQDLREIDVRIKSIDNSQRLLKKRCIYSCTGG